MRVAVGVAAGAAGLAGCSDVAPAGDPPPASPTTRIAPPTAVPSSPAEKPSSPVPTSTRAPKPASPPRPTASEVVWLAIPAIGVRDLRVVAYPGTADDRAGTRIQDRGAAASPRGPAGGVGPAEVGNFIVTGHRTSHGRPLGRLPEVATGDHILVSANGFVYDYLVSRTMTISFRKPAERAQQNAAVPGRPGARPTAAMITISTCATPEDNAAGNYWRDALGNPEHRINKIGILVSTRPA